MRRRPGVATGGHAGGHQRRDAAVDDDVDPARPKDLTVDAVPVGEPVGRAGCDCSGCCRSTTTTS